MSHFRPTPLDLERFTCGDCHILARAISRVTGWPIHALTSRYGDGEPTLHAFVLAPGAVALDIEGARPVDKLIEKWAKWEVAGHVKTSWREIGREWGRNYDNSSDRAAKIAPRLVERHFGSLV